MTTVGPTPPVGHPLTRAAARRDRPRRPVVDIGPEPSWTALGRYLAGR